MQGSVRAAPRDTGLHDFVTKRLVPPFGPSLGKVVAEERDLQIIQMDRKDHVGKQLQ